MNPFACISLSPVEWVLPCVSMVLNQLGVFFRDGGLQGTWISHITTDSTK